MKTYGTFLASIFFSFIASAQTAPSFMYSGILTDGTDNPITSTDVDISVKIFDPGTCELYYEEHNNLDLSGSDGRFAIAIGSGTAINSYGNSDLDSIFKDSGSIFGNACGPYSPNAGDKRQIQLTFTALGVGGPETLAKQQIHSVPQAMVAKTLNGKTDMQFVQVNAGSNLTQGNLEALLTGGGFANLSFFSGLCATGEIPKMNAGVWECATDASGGAYTAAPTGGLSLAGSDFSINTTDISTCTNIATQKIVWDSINNRLICATDAGGAGSVTSLAGATGALSLMGSVTSGTDTGPTFSEAGGMITLNIPLANNPTTTGGGLLTNADYTSFNAKLNNILAPGNIFVGNGSSQATGVAMNGDATIDSFGAITIANDAITTEKILNDTVTADKIADGAIDALAKLGSMTCTPYQILKLNAGGTAWECANEGGGGPTNLDSLDDASTSGGTDSLLIGTNFVNPGGMRTTAVGINALNASSSGNNNTAFGAYASNSNMAGFNNTAIGANALRLNTGGESNTAIGNGALQNNTGSYNTAVGDQALNSTSGSNNTAIGQRALHNNTGGGNVGIGFQAGVDQFGASNKLFISNTDSNNLIEGDFGSFEVYLPNSGSKFGIGTGIDPLTAVLDVVGWNDTYPHLSLTNEQTGVHTWLHSVTNNGVYQIKKTSLGAPSIELLVNGDVNMNGCIVAFGTGVLSGGCASDARFKRNVASIDSTLDKISQIDVVSYDWREDMKHVHGREGSEVGLIAQELEKIFPDMVVTDEDGYKRIRYGVSFQLHQLKAVVEMSHKVKALEKENAELRSEIEKIKAHLGMN